MASVAGYDFGTSNCAMGTLENGQACLVNLPQHGRYQPSTLYAPRAEVIAGWLYRQLKTAGLEKPYEQARKQTLATSLHLLKEARLDGYGDELEFGQSALQHYLADPGDCYYVRSPKSFLGSSGVTQRQQQMFEDIATSMMWHTRQQVAQAGGGDIRKVVIGRPVNFQGFNSENSNQQAIGVLTRAVAFAGFEQAEFLFEPIAAGLSYQEHLSHEQRVLVIDIGGGTSDVSMLVMGPQFRDGARHEEQVVGFSGERIGGNDFDIALNNKTLMPSLGAGLKDGNGRPIPLKPFQDAAAVNHISSQTRFYSKDTRTLLQELQRQPGLDSLSRLLILQAEQMTFQLSAVAERAKIALSEHRQTSADLAFIEPDLAVVVEQEAFIQSAQRLLQRLAFLVDEVINQAGGPPDTLFLTGGSANAPFVQEFLRQRYQVPMVSADNFGSVTAGLTLWANRIYDTK